MRTPETYYVAKAFIRFRKKNGIVNYFIGSYKSKKEIPDEFPEGVGSGIIRDEAHAQKFLKCKTLEEMLKIHNLGSVKT